MMYDQFKANYYTQNATDYDNQGSKTGLINQPNNQTKGRRDEILNLRKKEKLKNNLLQQLGPDFQQDIEQIVETQADNRLNQNIPVDDIQNDFKELIVSKRQMRNNPMTQSLQFNSTQQYPLTDRTTESQRRKRHLPIMEKQSIFPSVNFYLEIFNEWAAVAQHQDEIVKMSEHQAKMMVKDRQQKYKDDLDYQKNLRQQNQMNQQMQDQVFAQAMIQKDNMGYLNSLQEQEQKRKKFEQMKKENQNLSLGDYKDKLNRDHQNRVLESQRFKSQYDQTMTEQQQKDLQDKLKQKQDQAQYKDILDYQASLKNKPKDDESNLNGQWQAQQMEQNRQRYLDLINGKKNATEASRDYLDKYLQNNRQDEKDKFYKENEKYENQNYQKELLREQNDEQRRLSTRRVQNQALDNQVGMKNLLKQTDRDADQFYGQQVRAKAQAEEILDKQKKELMRKQQEDYSKTLEQQMNSKNMMKQFDSVMTEHERRVNDADIRAYQNVDQLNLYHKIPGIKQFGQEIQDKYLDKAFNKQFNQMDPTFSQSLISPRQQQTQPQLTSRHYQTSNQNQLTDQTPHQPHVNPNIRFQSARHASFDPMRAKYQSQIQSQPNIQSNLANTMFHQTENKLLPTHMMINSIPHIVPENKLMQVRQNMELPQTLISRHNTGNKAYGFEQFIANPIDQKPTYAANNNIPDGDFPYNYTVAPNYKMDSYRAQ
ncbi:UNKNOWN [Stylonychia lemnae]|uniref:Uncharacterized protein n=1 Tax=Stylonychia lemnae TaxID=5949 RepID=A0A077ZYF5_STYLE|nr:UNKNOWN [Stylonychia lemnae]|eukprot:CDW74652.1 UNKNOWN [Stylonychia lemnae]